MGRQGRYPRQCNGCFRFIEQPCPYHPFSCEECHHHVLAEFHVEDAHICIERMIPPGHEPRR